MPIQFRDDPDQHRYVAEDDDHVAGIAVYHLRGGRHIFVHTEVSPEYAGKGIGSQLARFALDDVRAKGGTVVPLCPFIASWVKQHPEYDDIVDQVLLDRINGGTRG
jgi:uncharacterized protein